MTMTELQTKVRDNLDGLTLVHGVGGFKDEDMHNACTVSAINLALTGVLTDRRPDCVHPVIHAWVIPVQDQVSVGVLNGNEWRGLVPLIAGTVGFEDRLPIIMDAMWEAMGWIVPDEAWREAWAQLAGADG